MVLHALIALVSMGKPFKDAGTSPPTDAPCAKPFEKAKVGAAPEKALEDHHTSPGDNIPWPAAQPEKDNHGHRPFRLKE